MKPSKVVIISLIFLILIVAVVFKSNEDETTKIKAHKLTIREEYLKSVKFDELDQDLIIAYFSDLHYGLYTNSADVEKIIETINSVNPDVVIFGGDLFDNYANLTKEKKTYLLEKFQSINASVGKYAVLGENDLINENIYSYVKELLQEADFNLLTNTNCSIYKNGDFYFNLIGLDSLVNGNIDIQSAFDGIDQTAYNITVAHCPDSFDLIDSDCCDYFLAGHSHGIQIYFPLINYFYRPYGANKYPRGKYHRSNTTIDVTNGVGLKEKSIRLFADAEVVFYKIQAN